MKIEFSSFSKIDYDEAIAYYKRESIELATRFKYDIKQSIKRIETFPNLYPKIEERVHKCVASKFPFTIFYTLKDDTIYILAIANHYKNPANYLDRFSQL